MRTRSIYTLLVFLFVNPFTLFHSGCHTLSPALLLAQAPPEPAVLMTDTEINRRVAGLGLLYSLDSADLKKLDKIITYEKEVFVGKVFNISFTEVRFTGPPDGNLKTVSKSAISQILYADGRRDVFIPLEERSVKQKELVDTARIIIKNQKDWMKVIVTEDPYRVTTLKPYGKLKASYEAEMGNATNDDLVRQAGIILKKRAALMKAHCVLIETKFFRKSYGDLPNVEITAIAYGY